MEQTKRVLKTIIDLLKIILISIILAGLVSYFIGGIVRVVGQSMEPTYHDSDILIGSKLSYITGDPERFDVAVIDASKNYKLIKRVIGLPGETVRIDENGFIYINGELLDESYGKEEIENAGNALYGITLGTDEYFVLGDNRNNSTDSRFDEVGVIKRSQFDEKVIDTIKISKHKN